MNAIIGGPTHNSPQKPRATCGGVESAKPLRYSTPQGPKGQMHQGPGLGGQNLGNGQLHHAADTSGSPGIGGSPSSDCDSSPPP